MISKDYARVCMHKQCQGHAVPATWMRIHHMWGTSYYCTQHANGYGLHDRLLAVKWVPLTPNQRPVSDKE